MNEIKTWVQPVTPEDARRWLDMTPTRQRKITRSHVEKLKQALLDVDAWLEGLHTGARLLPGDPRLTLRNHYLSGNGRGADTREHWGKVVKAWNAFASGSKLATLRFRLAHGKTAESMPTIRGGQPRMQESTIKENS